MKITREHMNMLAYCYRTWEAAEDKSKVNERLKHYIQNSDNDVYKQVLKQIILGQFKAKWLKVD